MRAVTEETVVDCIAFLSFTVDCYDYHQCTLSLCANLISCRGNNNAHVDFYNDIIKLELKPLCLLKFCRLSVCIKTTCICLNTAPPRCKHTTSFCTGFYCACAFENQMFKLPAIRFCLVKSSSTLASKTVSTVAIPPYIPTTALRL